MMGRFFYTGLNFFGEKLKTFLEPESLLQEQNQNEKNTVFMTYISAVCGKQKALFRLIEKIYLIQKYFFYVSIGVLALKNICIIIFFF